MPFPAFRVPFVLPLQLPKAEAQNGHAHAEQKCQKPNDDISKGGAAVEDAAGRFKVCVVAGLDFCGNAGHHAGYPHDQRKTRRRSGDPGDPAAPQPPLPLPCGDAPLRLCEPFFMTPHL